MRKWGWQALFLMPISLLFLGTIFLVKSLASSECIKSFASFAYDGPSARNFTLLPRPPGQLPPLSPWQIEATLPPHGIEGYYDGYGFFDVAITRTVEGHQEIWIAGIIYPKDYAANQMKFLILIYRPESQEWEFISSDVEDTGLYVQNLFVDSDNTVWGRNTWKIRQDYGEMETFPVLSRFDEETRSFEVAEGVLEIPLLRERVEGGTTYGLYDYTIALMDDQDNFWIFAQGDGLYRYDPVAQTTEERLDLTDIYVGRPVLAPDGTIYFSRSVDREITSTRELLSLVEGTLAQFIPGTGEMVTVDTPDDGWPVYSGLLFDHIGRLWLGSIGYRELDGSWHLIHPNPEAYFNMASSGHFELYTPPSIMLESSDGILWYQRFADTGGWVDGTGWYDPETGEGCMFTNEPAAIVEDSEQQLWLVADGKLYKYPLNP